MCARAGYAVVLFCFFNSEKPRRDWCALNQATLSKAFGFPEICRYKQGFTAHATVNQIRLPCQFYPSAPLVIWIAVPTGHTATRPSPGDRVFSINVPSRPSARWVDFKLLLILKCSFKIKKREKKIPPPHPIPNFI